MERILKLTFFALVLVHALVFASHMFTGYDKVFAEREVSRAFRTYVIREGAALNDVLEYLHGAQLAPQPLYVRFALLLHRKELVVKKGTYDLPEHASTWDLLQMFQEGRVRLIKLTLPEGLDKWQTAELLGNTAWGDTEDFLDAINDPRPIVGLDPFAKDLEGYLHPETYHFPEEATPRVIVASMVRQFLTNTETLRAQAEEKGLKLREWVALASMVEKETALENESPTIAGVFANRLNRDMLLQCDPTIIYSLKLDNLYKGKIYRSQILHDNPYNTYVYKGLPPGPIASPGLRSLSAALNPESTPYLFFVAQGDGSHYFSKTLNEHNRMVRKIRNGG